MALADSTKQAYKSGFQRYRQFCDKYHLKLLPTDEETLCFFVAHLHQDVQYPTIKLYLAAIRFFQVQHGMDDPLKDTPQLSLLLRGAQKQAKSRTRLPISPALLQKIVTTLLKNKHLCKHDRYLYAAAMTIAFFGCIRCGEITYPSAGKFNFKKHLTIRDLRISKNTMEVFIKHSKTDQTGKGTKVIIGPGDHNFCPLKLVQNFMHYRKHAASTDALFRFHNGYLLTRPKLQSALQDTLRVLGLPSHKYGTHSLRIGAATAAATAGIPLDIIKTMGRWSSECYRHYIRAPHKTLSELTSKLCHLQ